MKKDNKDKGIEDIIDIWIIIEKDLIGRIDQI